MLFPVAAGPRNTEPAARGDFQREAVEHPRRFRTYRNRRSRMTSPSDSPVRGGTPGRARRFLHRRGGIDEVEQAARRGGSSPARCMTGGRGMTDSNEASTSTASIAMTGPGSGPRRPAGRAPAPRPTPRGSSPRIPPRPLERARRRSRRSSPRLARPSAPPAAPRRGRSAPPFPAHARPRTRGGRRRGPPVPCRAGRNLSGQRQEHAADGESRQVDYGDARVEAGEERQDDREGEQRANGRHDAPDVEVIQRVHVGADPAQQVAAAVLLQPGWSQRLEAPEDQTRIVERIRRVVSWLTRRSAYRAPARASARARTAAAGVV